MSQNYILRFGTGNPTSKTGLSPTLSVFKIVPGGTNVTPPGVTELPSATGLYYFTYGPTQTISFVCDGGNTLPDPDRYVAGVLDPEDAIDEQITALGNTLVALGNTLVTIIGTTASSFGSTLTDPATVMGFLKRQQEFNEGNSIFDKVAATWGIFARGNSVGQSTMLALKTLSDSSGNVTKS